MPARSVPFRVLFVCTGNICRSPLAERLLRAQLTQRLAGDAARIEVTSAGARALVDEPMDRDSAGALTELGGDPEGFRARMLDAQLIKDSDLVLGVTRKHRATVARLDPASVMRVFTLREFARLAEAVDAAAMPGDGPRERLKAGVAEATANRGLMRAAERGDDDVRDPYGGTTTAHREAGARIAEAMPAVADFLARGTRPEAAPAHPPPHVDHAQVFGPRVDHAQVFGPAGAAGPPARDRHGGEGEEDGRSEDPAGKLAHDRLGREGGKRLVREAADAARKLAHDRRGKGVVGGVAAGVGVLLVVAAGWLAWQGFTAKRNLEAARPLVSDIKASLLAGDTDRAQAKLREMQRHTGSARDAANSTTWSAGTHLPWVGDDLQAVRAVARAVDDAANDIAPGLVDVGATLRPEALLVSGDRVNVEPLAAARPELKQAAARSKRLERRVDAIDVSGAAQPVRTALTDVRAQVEELADTTDTAATAATLLPPMLGAEGKRTYFLAFQTNAEARGTGGLLGAYGVLVADRGHIGVRHLGPNSELPSPPKWPIDMGPDFRALYGGTPPLWVNGNISPHFPYAGRMWSAMWQQAFGERLDGVIATDPVALGHVLKATGPARLPGGGQVSADDAVELTMQKVYERFPAPEENTVRDAFLQEVAGAVFDRLLSGSAPPKALAEQMSQAAGEGRLLVYSRYDEEQAVLEKTALGGAVPDTARPFSGLAVNNYSGSKLDYYLDRSLTYTRSACTSTAGRQRSRIEVTLTNTAPSRGLPAYVDMRLDNENFRGRPPKGANTDYLQVFATGGADLLRATLDGEELLVTGGRERGHAVFAFNVTLKAGQTRRIVLELDEPASKLSPRLMHPQPLVRDMTQRAGTRAC